MRLTRAGITGPESGWWERDGHGVYILGGWQSDFSANWARQGMSLAKAFSQVVGAFKQVTGTAGDCQIKGARTVQTLNIGGSTTTTVSLVVGL